MDLKLTARMSRSTAGQAGILLRCEEGIIPQDQAIIAQDKGFVIFRIWRQGRSAGTCRTVDAHYVAAEEDGHEGQKLRRTTTGRHDNRIPCGSLSVFTREAGDRVAGTDWLPIERDVHPRVWHNGDWADGDSTSGGTVSWARPVGLTGANWENPTTHAPFPGTAGVPRNACSVFISYISLQSKYFYL